MHGLPDRTALGVDGGDGLQNLRRAALARLGNVQGVGLPAHLAAHGLGLDGQAGQPEVGDAVVGVVGVHLHGQVLQALPVALVDRPLLGNVLLEVGNLPPDDAGDDVAHPVVEAHLLVLVPGSGLAALGGPLPGLVRRLRVPGQEHAAGGAGDDLVAVEGDHAVVAEGAGLPSLVGRAQGFGGVLHDQGAVLLADGPELVHLAGGAVEMGHDHQAHVGIERKGLLQGNGVHVPGVALHVDQDGLAALVADRVHRGVEGGVRREDPPPLQHPVADLRLAVEPLARQPDGQMQGGSSRGEADRVAAVQLLADQAFHFVDVFADGADPVLLDRVIDPLLLQPVHRGGGQPYLFLKGLDLHHSSLLFQPSIINGSGLPVLSVFRFHFAFPGISTRSPAVLPGPGDFAQTIICHLNVTYPIVYNSGRQKAIEFLSAAGGIPRKGVGRKQPRVHGVEAA